MIRAKDRGTTYELEKAATLSGDIRVIRVTRFGSCVECGEEVAQAGNGRIPSRCPTHARMHRRRKERARLNGTTYEQERERDHGLPCVLCGGVVNLQHSGRRTAANYCTGCGKSGRARRHRNIRNYYGATAEQATLIMDATECATCGTALAAGYTHVDHDHDTGQIRGVLCASCNYALGHIRDDPATAVALAAYLLGYRAPTRDESGATVTVAFGRVGA